MTNPTGAVSAVEDSKVANPKLNFSPLGEIKRGLWGHDVGT